MTDQLKLCRWPTLPGKYDLALHQAIVYILERFSVVGIIAAGSILRGIPDASSDLDLYVIHKAAFRQRLQKFFNGVPAEIFVNPPAVVERYLMEEQQERQPITAHMLATGYIVLAVDPVIEDLRQKAQALLLQPPGSPGDLTMPRYMIANLYEDAVDVVERDMGTGRMLLGRSVEEMLNFYFVISGKFLPRAKDLLSSVAQRDIELGRLARCFFEAVDLSEQLQLAEEIAERTIQAKGFFEWESDPEVVITG